MKTAQEILAQARSMGFTCDPMTDEEYEKWKADGYNATEGHLNEQDGYDCKLCKNKGDIWKAGKDYRGAWTHFSSTCRCMEVRNSIRRMKKSGLKDIIKDYTFDKFEASEPWQKTIKESAMQYAKNPEGWFFLGGQSGAGKTHICTAICREFLLGGRRVVYMLWRDDVSRLKGMTENPDERAERMERFKRAEVLYIDDLFKMGKDKDGKPQKPTSTDVNLAFEIINYRYNNPDKITIISSECTTDDLVDIDEAVGGRIAERSRKFNLKKDRTKNYRLRGATEL